MNAPIIGTIEIPRLTELSKTAKRRGQAALDAGRNAYLAGLGVVAAAQEETTKAIDAIVERTGKTYGTLVERGESLDRKRAEAVTGVRERLAARRDAALDRLDDGVLAPASRVGATVVRTVGMPTREEVRSLAANVAALSRKVDALVLQLGAMPTVVVEPTITVTAADEGWVVAVEGVPQPLSIHPTKDDAVESARALAAERAPSHLIVYKKDGTIQDKVTYNA